MMTLISRPLSHTLLTLLLSIFILSFTSGCNTMQGAGEDIEQAGDAVEDTIDEAAD